MARHIRCLIFWQQKICRKTIQAVWLLPVPACQDKVFVILFTHASWAPLTSNVTWRIELCFLINSKSYCDWIGQTYITFVKSYLRRPHKVSLKHVGSCLQKLLRPHLESNIPSAGARSLSLFSLVKNSSSLSRHWHNKEENTSHIFWRQPLERLHSPLVTPPSENQWLPHVLGH